MPVQIDDFHTEIEMTPSRAAADHARPAEVHARPPAMSSEAHRRSVLAVLESELDHYLRMRG